MKVDVYQVITERIIRLLERGTVPWHQPWHADQQWPRNLVSKRLYRGINVFLLNAARYTSPFWLTFRQVQSLGGRIRSGEHACPVAFWKILDPNPEKAEAKRIPLLRYYNVFNISQCEGVSLEENGVPRSHKPFEPISACAKVVSEMRKPPRILHGRTHAAYSPTEDEVAMPHPEVFESPEAYYSTLFHELAHSTGHASRLARSEITTPTRFGSDPYSREELVAEMGASYLCAHCGLGQTTIEDSASYIQHWIESLRNDGRLIVQAAASAQKAADYILGISPIEESHSTHTPKEYKLIPLRECPLPADMQFCEKAEVAVEYWNLHVRSAPHFLPDCECLIVLILNTRRRIRGHYLVSIGILDTILVHPREVFRIAIALGASAILLMHNHPSGEPEPSDADVRVTRELIRAGQLLKIELCDHVIVGNGRHASLREMGFFCG